MGGAGGFSSSSPSTPKSPAAHASRVLRSSSGCTNSPVEPGWCRHRSGHVQPLSAGTGMNAIRPASPVSRVTPSGQLRCPVDPTGTRKYTARLPLTSSTTGPGSPKVI
ncbi:hypothetical protein HX747_15655 [Streptomyces sp. L06]|nr:hypothetical protein [Streptomyces sp. L06]